MKLSVHILALCFFLALSACGSKDKAQDKNANAPALQRQADIARASLQSKADDLARRASVVPPQPDASTTKHHDVKKEKTP